MELKGGPGGIRTPDHRVMSPALYLDSATGINSGVNYNHIEPIRDNNVLNKFYEWCIKNASEHTCRQYIGYLKRPLDTGNKWSVLAYKKFFKYIGREDLWKSIKTIRSKPDIFVPSLSEVFNTIRRAEPPYKLVYICLLQSGLRVNEVTYVMKNINELRIVELNDFIRVELNLQRGSKKAFWGYFLEKPEKIEISARDVSEYARKHGLLAPKYIRKFVATKMIELGINESIIDFIQGRTPNTILTKHYAELLVAADKAYKKYAEWLRDVGFL